MRAFSWIVALSLFCLAAGAADFKVQRGLTTLAATVPEETIFAGQDYVAPSAASKAWIRVIATHYTPSIVGAFTPLERAQVYFSNPSNITTSVNLTRTHVDVDVNVYWEIVEYIGPDGGDNEVIVRRAEAIALAAGNSIGDTTAISGIVDDNDVVVFITGQQSTQEPETRNQAGRAFHTSEWIGASDVARLERGIQNSAISNASIAVVEFTGSNWAIQRKEHVYVAANSPETETLDTPLGSIEKTFLHPQLRVGIDASAQDSSHEIWISSLTQLTFMMAPNANITKTPIAVTWVIENTQDSGAVMDVEHISGTRASGQPEPDAWTHTIAPVASLSGASVEGFTAAVTSNGDPTVMLATAELTALDTLTLRREETHRPIRYRISVVEWPEAAEVSGSVVPVFFSMGEL